MRDTSAESASQTFNGGLTLSGRTFKVSTGALQRQIKQCQVERLPLLLVHSAFQITRQLIQVPILLVQTQ